MLSTSTESMVPFTSRLAELIRWERKLAYGRGSSWQSVGVLLLLPITVGGLAVAFWLAHVNQWWPDERYSAVAEIHRWAVLILTSTPFRDRVLDIGQVSVGYTALRITLYVVVLFIRMILPAVAAGSIGKDRLSGRLEEMRTTVLSPSSVFLAKAIAISMPFVLWSAFAIAPFTLVALLDGTSFIDVFRLWVELLSTIAFVCAASLFCSVAARSPWTARVNAYILVWALAPFVWCVALAILRTLEMPDMITVTGDMPGPPSSFAVVCWTHFAVSWAGFLAAMYFVSVKLFGGGFWASIRRHVRMQGRNRQMEKGG